MWSFSHCGLLTLESVMPDCPERPQCLRLARFGRCSLQLGVSLVHPPALLTLIKQQLTLNGTPQNHFEPPLKGEGYPPYLMRSEY